MTFPKITEADRIHKREAKRADKQASDEARDEVDQRSGKRCEVRIMCSGAAETAKHHRKRAGRKDTKANLLAVCESCHRWIHANVAKSYELGLLVRSTADPALIPVLPPVAAAVGSISDGLGPWA